MIRESWLDTAMNEERSEKNKFHIQHQHDGMASDEQWRGITEAVKGLNGSF